MKLNDEVVILECGQRTRSRITRETKTLWICAGCGFMRYERKFYKDTLYEVGNHYKIKEITENDIEYFRHNELYAKVKTINWAAISADKLEHIIAEVEKK